MPIIQYMRLLPLLLLFLAGCCGPRIVIIIAEPQHSSEPKIPAGIAFLKVRSSPPFATYWLNSSEAGETPSHGYIPVPAGSHLLQIAHRQFPPKDTILVLRPGEVREVKLQLLP